MEHILNHLEQAKARLLSQFKNKPNFEAILEALCLNIQEIEDVLFSMVDSRSLSLSTGVTLDYWGQLLNKSRDGLDDDLYRIVLIAKVAENVSNGTAEDVMIVFKLLMRARYVEYIESYPASFQVTAIDALAIGNIEDIKTAVKRTKPAGVSADLFAIIPGDPFVFFGDPDPQGAGFMDLNNTSTGGYLSSIV